MIRIPSENKRFSQANQSDLFGNIHITKNVMFDDEGYLTLSPSSRSAMDESVDTDWNNPAVVLFSSDFGYFIETWEEPFSVQEEILTAYPSQITDANHPNGALSSDAVWFGGLMPVSEDNDVHYYDPAANSWTDTNISLTAANTNQHQLVHFVSLNALAVVDTNTIKLYASPLTATPTLITTLTIPSDFKITSACYKNQNLYIGTRHMFGGHAYLYVWNGLGTSAGQAYEVESNMIFSVCPYLGGIALLTGNGSLLSFNGGNFSTLDNFPIYYTDQSVSDETNASMYKNIMKASGDILYILFSNENNDTNRLIDQPDGVWCYDPKVGLYHRFSLSNALVNIETINTSAVNTTTNEITVVTAPPTGTEVVYTDSGGTEIGGLTDDVKYFTIKVNATTIKLATTLANANAGTAIDLTGTGGNTQKLIFYPNIDFGQYFVERTTCLTTIERPVTNRIYGTEIIWGAEVIRRDSTNDYGTLGTVSDGVEARGYFISPKSFSRDVTDNYNHIALKYSPFQSELDKIIIKYRTKDDMMKYVNLSGWDITWTSSTTFTTTQSDWADAVAGNEIEVLRGAAGGLLAHISTITENAGTYTVTIDETYANYASGDVSKAVFRNWTKLVTITQDSPEYATGMWQKQLGPKLNGKFLQVKVELRGVRTRIEELNINNVKFLSAKQS